MTLLTNVKDLSSFIFFSYTGVAAFSIWDEHVDYCSNKGMSELRFLKNSFFISAIFQLLIILLNVSSQKLLTELFRSM